MTFHFRNRNKRKHVRLLESNRGLFIVKFNWHEEQEIKSSLSL